MTYQPYTRTFAGLALSSLTVVSMSVSAAVLSLDKSSYKTGQTVQVSWSEGANNGSDWIGIYPADGNPGGSGPAISWGYAVGTEGSLNLTAPNDGGDYYVGYMLNNGYTEDATRAPFSVVQLPRVTLTVNGLPSDPKQKVITVDQLAEFDTQAVLDNITLEYSVDKMAGLGWEADLQLTVDEDGYHFSLPESYYERYDIKIVTSDYLFVKKSPKAQNELRVMTFNIQGPDVKGTAYAGLHHGRAVQNLREIVSVDADIVGLQEFYPNHWDVDKDWFRQQLTRATGDEWYSCNHTTFSRYPVINKYYQGCDIELPGGRQIYMGNIHVGLMDDWSNYYLPYAANKAEEMGWDEGELIRRARMNPDYQEFERDIGLPYNQRYSVLKQELNQVPNNTPMFVTGDFNEPSHYDYTEAAAAAEADLPWKSRRIPMAIAAPMSTELTSEYGLSDTFHEARNNWPLEEGQVAEVMYPGITWGPTNLVTQSPTDAHRIDYVYFGANGVDWIKVKDAKVVGEAPQYGRYKTPNDRVDIQTTHERWSADHRAVVGIYELTPAANVVKPETKSSGGAFGTISLLVMFGLALFRRRLN